MKRWTATVVLLGTLSVLGGCYNDPGYSYVRGGGGAGDAYYGTPTTTYSDSYEGDAAYDPFLYGGGLYNAGFYPGFYPGYGRGYGGYGGRSGVSVGVGSVWRVGGENDRDYHRDDREAYRDASRDHGWYGRAEERRRARDEDRGERRGADRR